jgi:hypothetical protein
MTEKIYKIILLGKIADGHDKEIAVEKLALVLEIELKTATKLLKKPVVLRKNLTREFALRYKTGLEKIGIPSEISPPIEEVNTITTDNTDEHHLILEEENHPILEEAPPPKLTLKKELIVDGNNLKVLDIQIPFWSLVIFWIKWFFASIPALIIISGIVYLIRMGINLFGGLF